MRSTRTWKAFLRVFLLIGISLLSQAYSDIEIKMAHAEEDQGEIILNFPRPFEENERLLNVLLYQMILSRAPTGLHETLTFDQKRTSLHFYGGREARTFLQENVLEILHEGIEQVEFLEAQKHFPEAKRVELEDLNRWIEMFSLTASFPPGFNTCLDKDRLDFSSINLDELTIELVFAEREGTHHFYALRLTPDDCYNISKLIKSMADLSLWELLKKSKEMKKLGRKIEPVHPFRFLGYILSNHELKKRMFKIKGSHFKWNKFIEGLFNRLSKEADRDNLNRFIPGFVQMIDRFEMVIEDCVRRHHWAEMLDYCLSD